MRKVAILCTLFTAHHPSCTSCTCVHVPVAIAASLYTDDIDPRDLRRLQADLHHALKYIRHNRGNFDSAYNMMVRMYLYTVHSSIKHHHSVWDNYCQPT